VTRPSLRLKITGAMVGLILVGGVAGALKARSDLLRIGHADLERRARNVAWTLGVQHAELLLTNDIFTLYELVNGALLTNPDIRYIVIFDQTGAVRVSSFTGGVPRGLRDANMPAAPSRHQVRRLQTDEGTIYDVAFPVLDGQAGVVRVGMLEAPLYATVNRQTTALLGLTAAGMLLAGLVAYGIGSLLTRPLAQLVAAAQAVARGDLGRQAPVFTRDEVGEVALAFNAMTDALARMTREREEVNRQLRLLLEQVITAQEDERKRVARELHDEFAQTLTALAMELEAAARRIPPELPAARDAVMRTHQRAIQSIEEVRRLILDLRPVVLDDHGLVPALRWYAERCLAPLGIAARVAAPGWRRRLDPRTEVVIFRIVQEALNNIARHSGATEAEVRLELGDDRLDVTVTDNGRGFAPHARTGAPAGARGLGLLGMRERASLLGGEFAVESALGRGTRVRVRVPLRPPDGPDPLSVRGDARAAS
jgi:signal transduction histidine kinase